MKIRIIQLINNFYKDGGEYPDKDTDKDRRKALGDYCTFGYFDAMQVRESRSISRVRDSVIWQEIHQTADKTIDGTCSRRNLICIVENENKDIDFWSRKKDYPYLFVSLIRVKHHGNTANEVKDVMQKINKEDTAIAYYSYNHSELVMVKLERHYASGLKFMTKQRQQIQVLNMYSIFSIRENILNRKSEIRQEAASEQVDVRLHIIIKDDREIDGFLYSLLEELSIDKEDTSKYRKYHTLGSCDMLFEIEQVDMHKLLPCYCMGNLLTHTNEKFEKAIFNIETEILAEREKLGNGKLDDRKDTKFEKVE